VSNEENFVSSENPYKPPQVTDPIVQPQQLEKDGIWRQGSLLVMRKDAVLPDRCIKSNVATDRKLKRSLNWHPSWVFLTILISLCVYIVIALILSKKATIRIGLSDEWFAKRSRAILIGWGSVLASIGMLISGGAMIEQNDAFGILILAGVVLFLFGAIYGLIRARMISPTKIDDAYVWIKGANAEYLASFPIWPG
jgi:hypothetical protein